MQLRAFTPLALAGVGGIWAGVLGGMSPALQLAGILGPTAALLTVHRPTFGFLALFALLPILHGVSGTPLGLAGNYALPVLLIGLVATDRVLRTETPLRPLPGRLGWWFAGFLFWIVVCSLMSSNPVGGLVQAARFGLLGLFLLALWNWLDRRDLGRGLLLIAIGMVPVAILALQAFLAQGPAAALAQQELGSERVTSLYRNPNTLGKVMGHGILVLSPWLLTRFSRRQSLHDAIVTGIGTATLLLFALGLLSSFSRGSLLYAAAGLGTLALMHRGLRWVLLGGGLTIVLVLILVPLPEWLTIALRLESGTSLRGSLWSAGWHMMLDNPWFGIGPGSGNFEELRSAYIGSIHNRSLFWSQEGGAHNVFLHRGAVMGIPGLLATIALFLMVFRALPASLRAYRLRGDWIAGIAAAGIVGLTVRGLFEIGGTLEDGRIVDAFFFILVLVVLGEHDRSRSERRAHAR